MKAYQSKGEHVNQLAQINNLQTLFVSDKNSTSASIQFWFRAGSALENKTNEGVAHFLEHMFFKGSKKYPGSKIAYEIESFGGEVNAFTSFDYTCYYINSPADYLNKSLNILLDMVANPLFLKKDLVPEREVVLEEFNRSQDEPSQFMFQKIQKNSFSDKYNHPILGNKKTILNFSREQIQSFRKANYNSSNAFLIVAGPVELTDKGLNKYKKMIAEYRLPKGQASKFPKFEIKQKKDEIFIHNKQVRQAELTLCFSGPSTDKPEASEEDLALNCLAYGETSPLYQELVHKTSLCSNIGASTLYLRNGSTHLIKMALPEKNFKQALSEFKNVLLNVKKNGFKETEITRIKNQYLASKIYERESIESYASSMGYSFALTGDIHSEKEYLDRIKACNEDQVLHAFNRMLSMPIHFHLQLPLEIEHDEYKKEILALQKELKNEFKPVIKKFNLKLIAKGKTDPEIKHIKIQDGISLVYRHHDKTPTYAMNAFLKGGLVDENKKNNGSHYLLTKMLNYGHSGKDYLEYKNELSIKASYISSICGKNAYGMQVHGLSEYFDSVVTDLTQTILNPNYQEDFLKLEKELVLRMHENIKEDPTKICFLNFSQNYFGDHPYALSTIGTVDTIKAIQMDSLKKMHQKNINERELQFTYCGQNSIEQVTDILVENIKHLGARKKISRPSFKVKINENQHIHIPFNREQTQIYIGFPSFSTQDKEDIYLKILTTFLSGQSSELFVTVRDKMGLCYVVQPVHHNALEAGHWGIYIVAGNNKVAQAIDAIMGILQKIANKGMSNRDFNRTKKMIMGHRSLTLQTNDDYINFYSIPTLHGLGLEFEHKRSQTLQDCKLETFNRFIKKFLKQNRLMITVGDQSTFNQ